MSLVRWMPSSMMNRNWNRLMEEMFGDIDNQMVTRTWLPRMDIVEEENGFRILADLPGMSRDDIDITFEDGVLTISGERKHVSSEKKESLHLNERVYGNFSRSFTLGSSIHAEKISASFRDGVLTITLPKAEEAKPKKIEIKAA